jgi:hypothetical protein
LLRDDCEVVAIADPDPRMDRRLPETDSKKAVKRNRSFTIRAITTTSACSQIKTLMPW